MPMWIGRREALENLGPARLALLRECFDDAWEKYVDMSRLAHYLRAGQIVQRWPHLLQATVMQPGRGSPAAATLTPPTTSASFALHV